MSLQASLFATQRDRLEQSVNVACVSIGQLDKENKIDTSARDPCPRDSHCQMASRRGETATCIRFGEIIGDAPTAGASTHPRLQRKSTSLEGSDDQLGNGCAVNI